MLRVLPSLAKLRQESELPKTMKLRTDIADPIRDIPNTESELPMRMKERRLRELP
jgi:hypothetical protein